jgi:hypothetical protein
MATGNSVDSKLQEALESEDMPTDILPMVWLGIKALIHDNSSMKEDISRLEIRTTSLEETSLLHDESIESLKIAVKSLDAKLMRSNITQASLVNEIDDLKSRSMRDNIIINFDQEVQQFNESQGENCVELVRAFLHDILGITNKIYIQSAHRLGRPNVGKRAKIPEALQRSLIFQNANRLRDTRHYISQQMTPARSERRQFALPEYKELKGDVRNKAVLTQDKLFVKNKLQTKFVKPNLPIPPPSDEAPCYIAESQRDKKMVVMCIMVIVRRLLISMECLT